MRPVSDPVAEHVSEITIRRGSIYLTAQIYLRYFHGLEAVVLQRHEDDLLILPVRHAASGGYLLKIRNFVGDRVINAMDFLRNHGLDADAEIRAPVFWNSEYASLVAAELFASAK